MHTCCCQNYSPRQWVRGLAMLPMQWVRGLAPGCPAEFDGPISHARSRRLFFKFMLWEAWPFLYPSCTEFLAVSAL